jgi:hypothetical protein
MRLVEWRPLRQGKLFGFASVMLPIGLQINECPILAGVEGVWAALPSRPEVDRDGVVRTGANGARLYQPVLEWRSRRLREAFSQRVVALVSRAYPVTSTAETAGAPRLVAFTVRSAQGMAILDCAETAGVLLVLVSASTGDQRDRHLRLLPGELRMLGQALRDPGPDDRRCDDG